MQDEKWSAEFGLKMRCEALKTRIIKTLKETEATVTLVFILLNKLV